MTLTELINQISHLSHKDRTILVHNLNLNQPRNMKVNLGYEANIHSIEYLVGLVNGDITIKIEEEYSSSLLVQLIIKHANICVNQGKNIKINLEVEHNYETFESFSKAFRFTTDKLFGSIIFKWRSTSDINYIRQFIRKPSHEFIKKFYRIVVKIHSSLLIN